MACILNLMFLKEKGYCLKLMHKNVQMLHTILYLIILNLTFLIEIEAKTTFIYIFYSQEMKLETINFS
jgi:hypothetical protein